MRSDNFHCDFTGRWMSPAIEGLVPSIAQRCSTTAAEQNSAAGVYASEAPVLKINFEPAGPPDVGVVLYRVLDMSEGGNERMRPVRRSSQRKDQSAPVLEVDAESNEMEAVPAECPGVFIEQPLERWSPRDLMTGMFRLVRWTRLATS